MEALDAARSRTRSSWTPWCVCVFAHTDHALIPTHISMYAYVSYACICVSVTGEDRERRLHLPRVRIGRLHIADAAQVRRL